MVNFYGDRILRVPRRGWEENVGGLNTKCNSPFVGFRTFFLPVTIVNGIS